MPDETYTWPAGRSGLLCGQRICITHTGPHQHRTDLVGETGEITNPFVTRREPMVLLEGKPDDAATVAIAGVFLDRRVPLTPGGPAIVHDHCDLYEGDKFVVIDDEAAEFHEPPARLPDDEHTT